MVTLIRNADAAQDALVITPYAPLSGGGSLLVLLIVWTPIVSVACICGLLGNWYVLPFSLSVCCALGLAFRAAHRRTQIREVVSLSGGQVSIERGHRYPEHSCSLPCTDAKVLLQSSPAGEGEHLYLYTRDQRVEVGDFLDESERHELADRLGELIRAYSSLRHQARA